MVSVTYSDEIRHDPEMNAIAESASGKLQEILSEWRLPVAAKWEVSPDHRQVVIALSDEWGEFRRNATPAKLKDPDNQEHLLRRVWDDLLANRSKIQMRKILDWER